MRPLIVTPFLPYCWRACAEPLCVLVTHCDTSSRSYQSLLQ